VIHPVADLYKYVFLAVSESYIYLFLNLQVDKHIRRLDSDLARFEAEIQDKALSNSRNQEDSVSTKSMVFEFILVLSIKPYLLRTYMHGFFFAISIYQNFNNNPVCSVNEGRQFQLCENFCEFLFHSVIKQEVCNVIAETKEGWCMVHQYLQSVI